MIYPAPLPVPEEEIKAPLLHKAGVTLMLRREDLNHPTISGNKYWKLKHNLLEAKKLGYEKVLTFGGAFSNHIAATAAACKAVDISAVGVIRGEEADLDNPTLLAARNDGMLLHRISRANYREKTSPAFAAAMREKFGNFYLIPEGGTNTLAIKGAAEMAGQITTPFDFLALPVGTGGTIAGCIEHQRGKAQILGFSSLKGGFLIKEIQLLQQKYGLASYQNWTVVDDYHFGGYARVTPDLIAFIKDFEQQFAIPLDPIYTGKMMFGLFDIVRNAYFSQGSVIYAIHTGGLQGRAGFENLFT